MKDAPSDKDEASKSVGFEPRPDGQSASPLIIYDRLFKELCDLVAMYIYIYTYIYVDETLITLDQQAGGKIK